MDNPVQKCDSVKNNPWGQGHYSFLVVRYVRGVWPLQFNWFRATMHLYSSLTHCNSTAAKHVLHADMRLSSRSDNC